MPCKAFGLKYHPKFTRAFTTESTESTEKNTQNGDSFSFFPRSVFLCALCVLCGSQFVWFRLRWVVGVLAKLCVPQGTFSGCAIHLVLCGLIF